MTTLTRGEFLKNPAKWRDIDHSAVIELKKYCYAYIKNCKRFYRDWFSQSGCKDELGASWDAAYLKLSVKVLEV